MQDDIKDKLSLGQTIKKFRLKRKWKLQTMSVLVGVAPSTLNRIERGISEPKYTTLKKIATTFGYSLSEFCLLVETSNI